MLWSAPEQVELSFSITYPDHLSSHCTSSLSARSNQLSLVSSDRKSANPIDKVTSPSVSPVVRFVSYLPAKSSHSSFANSRPSCG